MRAPIILSLLLLPCSLVQGQAATGPSSVGYPTVDAALAALKADPKAKIRVESGWTVVSTREANASATWSFTPPGHPAHPSAVKRVVFEKDGAVYLETKALCESTKAACDELLVQFRELERRLKDRIRDATGT